MANIFWPKALAEAGEHAHYPVPHYDFPRDIVMDFLWQWGNYPSNVLALWKQVTSQKRDADGRFTQDIFPILQHALTEGDQEDRVFTLFLLGGLATPKARDLLISFLASPQRKERWASAISLGRLKEERVFAVLPTLLLEGFAAHEIFASVEQWHATQEDGHLYRRTLEEQGWAEKSKNLLHVSQRLRNIDYEWYLRQRSECALVLGAWGHPAAVPPLREALQAAWRMEQDWPNYEGPDASGPAIWYVFQDRLVFALGQLGAWDALVSLHLPEAHLLIARIYLILGYLQVLDPKIFMRNCLPTLFSNSLQDVRHRIWMEEIEMKADLFVDPARVTPLLGEHFGLSPAAQDDALARFSTIWDERTKEIPHDPPPGQWPVGDLSKADLLRANLYGVDLSEADLHSADLSSADLSSADLHRANLHNANLHNAWLQGTILYEADLSDADLTRTDLSGANLSDANLSGADLSGAILYRTNLARANLSGVNLSDANLSGADLSGTLLHRTDFTRTILYEANLSGVNLSGADLNGANLQGALLISSNLSQADLSGADLSHSDLSRANLSGADLSGANLVLANLSYINMSNANGSCINLCEANLFNANLSGANLSGANLSEVCFTWANLCEVNLHDADLSGATGLPDQEV